MLSFETPKIQLILILYLFLNSVICQDNKCSEGQKVKADKYCHQHINQEICENNKCILIDNTFCNTNQLISCKAFLEDNNISSISCLGKTASSCLSENAAV
ncbi:hypothetical protein BJ944DRAFT_273676 [Cunninghamella echinulata]|nr:hypothetical protein BJ944DRAFT_273676 [Cunninghamella echinulata]